ncbi:methyl-accepting chemotaxis protein [Geobacter anodireducens]|uniref:Methyl-accepting chemotaxis protein n=1 Tax=Geobacter anodireducens TaxID=1340425 RepID=A0ABR9NYT2_9BACT|nr:methyl-accepting chemotaxis protein [Geobacter anodireducens]MBE2889431.1 methyl-accepting chemotaxis protein [Geobacter anodireducens]
MVTMKIRSKMLCILLFPLLGLVYFAAMEMAGNYRAMASARSVRTLTQLAVKASAMIHEAQKERGMTAGFLASGGARFGDELNRQRNETDSRINDLKTFVAANGEGLAPARAALDTAMADLGRLGDIRGSATSLHLAGKDSFAFYSGLIGSFTDLVTRIARTSSHHDLSREISAYAAFINAKEQAGRERATLNAVFTAGSFDDETYRRFVSILAAQDAYLRLFAAYASDGAVALLKDKMASPAAATVDEMRSRALERHREGAFGVDPRVWFTTITEKINAMKQVEDHLSTGVMATADRLATAASTAIVRDGVITLVLLVLALAGGLLLVGSITAPLRTMLAMLKDMAEGEGDLTKRLNADRTDELGEISAWFNTFTDKLHGIISRVALTTAEVASAAAHVYDTAEQMATGAEEVAAQSGTVATASEEMAATSAEIAQNCSLASEGANRASLSANDGAGVVESTVRVMGRIAERVNAAARTVEKLGARGEQIGEIIETIEDIADQTNLLALNAAIEAARAGEAGRGFAVVADEVRALAERTTRATREIAGMIKAIQSETHDAVSSMEEGVRDVESGTGEAARSGEALEDILSRINDVVHEVHQIATAAEQQTATTNEISRNMQEITDVVQQTAHGAQESALAAERLKRQAEELQRLVGQFRLAA